MGTDSVLRCCPESRAAIDVRAGVDVCRRGASGRPGKVMRGEIRLQVAPGAATGRRLMYPRFGGGALCGSRR